MKNLTITIAVVLIGHLLFGQSLVSQNPSYKTVVLEEFTGTSCPNCPAAHIDLANVMSANPNVIAIAYAPTTTYQTQPYNGGVSLRRTFPNAFNTSAYAGVAAMPIGFMNRKKYGSSQQRYTLRNTWATNSDAVSVEVSPLNIGAQSIFFSASNTLSIDVELFYHQNITNTINLYVLITEDNVAANQSAGNPSTGYIHNHIFRETVTTGQWGDAITGAKLANTYYNTTLSFNLNNLIDPIKLADANVVAFVYDQTTGEILTGVEVNAMNGTTNACVDDLSINLVPSLQTQLLDGTYSANNINCYAVGKVNENHAFKATTEITLENGFEIPLNSEFSAEIDTCQ